MNEDVEQAVVRDDGLRSVDERPSVARRRRLLLIVVGVAVVSVAASWVAAALVISPADADRQAQPPAPALITAAVELRVLTNSIVVRGDVQYTESTSLVVQPGVAPDGSGPAVVTGRLPQTGSSLAEGAVAVEVSGRPVLLLSGGVPMYRALGPGSVGEDVRQLEAALQRLGMGPGSVDGRFDQQTEAAVDRLYARAGYEPVPPTQQELDQVAAAQTQRDTASSELAAAQAALTEAQAGPSPVDLAAAEGEVALAQAQLDAAIANRDEAVDDADPDDVEQVRREHDLLVLAAQNRLTVAQAALDELTAPRDTTLEQQRVTQAQAAVSAAQAALDQARAAAGVGVPRAEVVFLSDLPRRVESVNLAVGEEPTGPVLSLSGSDLQVVTALTSTQRQLVQVGQSVRLDDQALGIDLAGTVVSVGPDTSDGVTADQVLIRPEAADPQQIAGLNLRVTIPVDSTAGPVLVVPVAAVATTADGASKVRLVRGDTQIDEVTVRVGLSAEGYLEVAPLDGDLAVGDHVVLGLQ